MAKNILIIDGSPRPGKFTQQVCAAFAKGAEANGHTVTNFKVTGKKIAGCIACMQCFKNGPCAQKDDMLPLIEQIEKADMIVLASPIYFWHITAQMKAVIDRMYSLYVAGRFQRKETVGIFVSGGDADCCDEAVNFYNNVIIGKLHWTDKGLLTVPRTGRDDFVLEEHLARAEALGKSIQ